MEIKRDKLQYLLDMDNVELADKLTDVMRAMGVEEKKIGKMVHNLPKLKETVCKMSDEQLSAFGAGLGEEKMHEIAKALDGMREGKNG